MGRDSHTVRHKHCTAQTMAANSEAEFRMMFLLNNMDINQEGQLSSEDRLFSSGTPRYQSENSQVNPFGVVRWEGGRPVYSAQTHHINSQQDQHQQFMLQQQQQMLLQQQQQQQQQRAQIDQRSP